MRKLCFSCFKRIPLFAAKCPYCLDKNQGVFGRIIFALLIIVGFFIIIHSDDKLIKKEPTIQETYTIEEVLKELKDENLEENYSNLH